MKILLIGKIPLDFKSVRGGIEAANLNLLDGFSKVSTANVEMVTFSKTFNSIHTCNMYENVKITFFPYKFRSFEFLNILFYERHIIKNLLQEYKPDIINYQGSGPHLLSVIGLSKQKIVITMHGLLFKELMFQFGIKMKIRVFIRAIFDQLLLKSFDNFIFISRYNQHQIRPRNGSKYPIIPNAIHNRFYKKDSDIALNQLLFVGAISKLKNLPLIFKVISELNHEGKQFYLTIAGGFKDKKYENYLLNLITQLNISSLISFKGWVNQDELVKLYDLTSLLILPSRQENLPVCILEAMAHGNVVVSSNVGGTSELIDNEITGFLFKDNDKEELKNILNKLYNNEALIKQVGANAHQKMEKFDSINIAKKTIKYYYKICKEN